MSESSGQQFYHPSKDVIEQANVKEYEKLYKYSIEHREDFGPNRQKSFIGIKNGIKFWTHLTRHSTNGLLVQKQILYIMPLIVINKQPSEINLLLFGKVNPVI